MTQTEWYAHLASPEYQAAAQTKHQLAMWREDRIVFPSLCPECLDINTDTIGERRERGTLCCSVCGYHATLVCVGRQWITQTTTYDWLNSDRVQTCIQQNRHIFSGDFNA